MISSDVKMAFTSLRVVKWRSFLTLLGIVIGVVSVVTIVSLGEGIKHQVSSQINRSGKDLITVRPGQNNQGNELDLNNLTSELGFQPGSLSERDFSAVSSTPDVRAAAPINFIAAGARSDDHDYNDSFIIGTNENFAELINQNIEFGNFFGTVETNRHVAIIGKKVAQQLFNENIPIGRSLTIHGQDFLVQGIFDDFQPNTLAIGMDFNKAIVIPLNASKSIANGNVQTVQIIAKPSDVSKLDSTMSVIKSRLTEAHGGQSDFSVLNQTENLALNNKMLNILTGFIGGIAAIALLVAGIGIMNIMLVSVTERTREIGIRKAIGATNTQLMSQFITEAVTLSLAGGVLGVMFSFLVNYLLRVFTDFKPTISLPVILLASGISVIIGISFGVIPAYKAARKDPIEALRYED